jgi:hypothetical protein
MTALARFSLVGVALAAALTVAAGAAADKGGPSPGVQLAGRGIVSADAALRYATRSHAGETTVTAFDADGRSVRSGSLEGIFGIPFVAFDGSLGGLSHDGRRLVLASPGTVRGHSRFAVLSTDGLVLERTVSLKGRWSFDALSPDGRRLYLVEHSQDVTYRVRAYDVVRGTLLREAVIDPRLGGRAMTGAPVTQARGPGGVWVYTLYQKPSGLPFVHALDTVRGKALCIELPWRGNQGRLFDVRMSVRAGQLLLRNVRGPRLATIDTRAFAVHAHHNPLRG